MAVVVEDHTDKILALINKKLAAGAAAAAATLADEYQRGLQANKSPPASRPGQIPHDAPDDNSSGPSNISRLIDSGVSVSDSVVKGIVGFQNSVRRQDNYLLGWDQGLIGPARPWVLPIYFQAKSNMQKAFNNAVEGAD